MSREKNQIIILPRNYYLLQEGQPPERETTKTSSSRHLLYLSTQHPSFLLETVPSLFHVVQQDCQSQGLAYTLAVWVGTDLIYHCSHSLSHSGELTKTETINFLPSKCGIKFGNEVFPFDSSAEEDELRAVISPSP